MWISVWCSVHTAWQSFCCCTVHRGSLHVLSSPVLAETYKDDVPMQDVREKLVNERQRMMTDLSSISFLQPFPSCANFVLCNVTNGYDAKAVKIDLAKQGIMVRHYAQRHLAGFIRISVGKPEQTDKLMSALRQL